jgi:hypothetical protein
MEGENIKPTIRGTSEESDEIFAIQFKEQYFSDIRLSI